MPVFDHFEHFLTRIRLFVACFAILGLFVSDNCFAQSPELVLIAYGEYFVDADPGEGLGIPLAAKDFSYNSAVEDGLQGEVDFTSLSSGPHRIGLRFKDGSGVWGVPVYTDVIIFDDHVPSEPPVFELDDSEWFVDVDYGEGANFPVAPIDGGFDTEPEVVLEDAIQTSYLDIGVHSIGLRFKDKIDQWGAAVVSTVHVYETQTLDLPADYGIVDAEYFWGEAVMPGGGFQMAWGQSPPWLDLANVGGLTNLPTAALSPGWHKLGARFKNSDGQWGESVRHLVQVVSEDIPFAKAVLHVESNIGIPAFNLDTTQRKGDSVALRVPPTIQYSGQTFYNMGWIGTGDVPACGTSNEVGFVINHDSTLTWLWSDRRTVSISLSNDFTRGAGAGVYLRFSNVTATVPGFVSSGMDTGWRVTGYTGTGSVPAGQSCLTQIVFQASVDSSISWTWTNQYRLVTDAVHGRVLNNWNWYDAGAQTELYPEPEAGYCFVRWQGDGSDTNQPGVFTVNGPKKIIAVFEPLPAEPVTLTIREIDGSSTQRVYAAGISVAITPLVPTVLLGEARDIAASYQLSGGVEFAGTGTNATVMLTGDVTLRWLPTRQYHLIPQTIPSEGGTIRLSANQSRAEADWYDAGLFKATAAPAAGYRFAGWYLKNWLKPEVEAILDERTRLVALFRREKPLLDFLEVKGGALTSPNTAAYNFEGVIPTFLLSRWEVTTLQYAQFLNECLEYKTIQKPNRLSVRGMSPLADYAQGLRVEYFSGDNVAAEPLFRNVATNLNFNFGSGSPANALYGTPVSTVALTDNYSMRYMGEIYVRTNGNVRFKEISDDKTDLYIDGQLILTDVDPYYNATALVTLTQGWHTVEVAYWELTGDAFLNIQWDIKGGTAYSNITSSAFRCQMLDVGWNGNIAGSGAATYYPDYELYDLDAPDANIEFVGDKYQPKAGATNHPVVEVTWYGADSYCRWLAECTGQPVDLPTEWQWEFAASAGNSVIGGRYFPWGPKFLGATHNNANYTGTGGIDTFTKTGLVGTFPSYSGLYDMAGNVWEWTRSVQSDISEWRVIRGGSWNQTADPYISTSYRLAYKSPDYGDEATGFRPAVTYDRFRFNEAGYICISNLPPLSSPNAGFGGFVQPQSPFLLRSTELMNSELVLFLNSALTGGYCQVSANHVVGIMDGWYSGKRWLAITNSPDLILKEGRFVIGNGRESYPSGGLTWYGAKAFCKWINSQQSSWIMDVPDEWQWENAMSLGSAQSCRLSTISTPIGQAGADVYYNWTFWPGFYDARASQQEWTGSLPDSALIDYASLRGGAWNLGPRDFSYRNDYASKETGLAHFVFRPAITAMLPQFGVAPHNLVLQPGSSNAQTFCASAFNPSNSISWALEGSPSWVSISELSTGKVQMVVNSPALATNAQFSVLITDGIMTNRSYFSVLVGSNELSIVGLSATVSFAQDNQTRMLFAQANSSSSNALFSWSLPDNPAWASISLATNDTAGIAIATSTARDSLLNISVSSGGFAVTSTVRVVIGNHAPVILSGPDVVDMAHANPYLDVLFTGFDPDAGQTLSWSVVGNPSWARVIWTQQGEAAVRIDRIAARFATNLVVMLTDGIVSDSRTVLIEDGNQSPVVIVSPWDLTVAPGDPTLIARLFATDNDISDTLSWTLETTTGWISLSDNGSGEAMVSITPTGTSTSTIVVASVSDGMSQTNVSFHVTVTNRAPVISGNASLLSTLNSGVVGLTYTATDADQHQSVTLYVTNSTPWFSWYRLTPSSIRVLVKTDAAVSGNVCLKATDGFLDTPMDVAVTIQASAPNDTPKVSGLPPYLNMRLYGATQQYTVTVTDADSADVISIRLLGDVPGMTLRRTGPRSAVMTIVPAEEIAPTFVGVEVSDGKVNVSATFRLLVGTENRNPYAVAVAEYFFDTEPEVGTGAPLTLDGNDTSGDALGFHSSIIIPQNLSIGHHLLGVRCRSVDGVWGNTVWSDVHVYENVDPVPPPLDPSIVDARYSVSTVIGVSGNNRALEPKDGYDSQVEDIATERFDTSPLINGTYRVHVQYQKNENDWGTNLPATFVVYDDAPVEQVPVKRIIGAEYFWDTPPSPGFGSPVGLVSAFDGQGTLAKVDVNDIGTAEVLAGFHVLGIRFQDETNEWGNPVYFTVKVETEEQPLTLINLHVESNIGDPDLAFDTQQASNTVMRLSVPEIYYYNNRWWAISGWIGVGDVPGDGTSNVVEFVLTKASDLTWIWVEDVEVYAYSDYGTVSGNGAWGWYPEWMLGYGLYPVKSNVTLSVDNVISLSTGERVVCTGFTGSGSAPVVGYTNTVTFATQTAVSSVTWQWEKQYQLTSGVVGAGRIFGNREWYKAGSVATLTAVPDEGQRFLRWEGAVTGDNSITSVVMNAACSVVAVFEHTPKEWKLEFVDPVTGATGLLGVYPDGASVTANYPRLTHMDVGRRCVVTGWTGEGSVPASGNTQSIEFTILTNSLVRWTGVQQCLVSLEVSPAALGSLVVTGSSCTGESKWLDTGVITVSNVPAEGARFLEYGRDLQGAPTETSCLLSGPLDVAVMFRWQRAVSDFVDVQGGSLTSSNTNAPGFEARLEPFAMKRTEVTNSEYVEYLNEALYYETAKMAGTNSVIGNTPLRPYARGLRGEFFSDNVMTGNVVSSRILTNRINTATLSQLGAFSPLPSLVLSNGFSCKMSGQLYIPTEELVHIRVTATGLWNVAIGPFVSATNSSGTQSFDITPGYGWSDFALNVINGGSNPVVVVEYTFGTNAVFSSIPATLMRHKGQRANTEVQLTEARIGGDATALASSIGPDDITVRPASGGNYVFAFIAGNLILDASVSTPSSGEAGLMMRADNTAAAPYYFVGINSSGQMVCRYRRAVSESEVSRTIGLTLAKPVQTLKLWRVGNRIRSAFLSGSTWLDVMTDTEEGEWIEVGTAETTAVMSGFYASTTDSLFSAYSFCLPEARNHYEGMELVNLDAEHCAIRWSGTNFVMASNAEMLPMVEATWFGAESYAVWLGETVGNDGFSLPSEWQLEFAGSGGDSASARGIYPWPTDARSGLYANLAGTGDIDIFETASAVGGMAPYKGFYDLGGNVWEWTKSLHWGNGEWRGIRGGAWNLPSEYAQNSYRNYYGLPYFSSGNLGFRPVKNVVSKHDYVWIPSGTLQSPNATAFGFTPTLDGYFIKSTEVTVADYAAFLHWAKNGGHISIANGVVTGSDFYPENVLVILSLSPYLVYNSGSGIFNVDPGYSQRPMTGVTWFGCKGYADYLGLTDSALQYDLPTEWEWERAATGGLDLDGYWTNALITTKGLIPSASGLLDVGSYSPANIFSSASTHGIFDMVANAAEWTATSPLYGADFRVIRGLAAGYPSAMSGHTYRGYQQLPSFAEEYLGFRVVARAKAPLVSMLTTNVGFIAESGTYYLMVSASNPRQSNHMNWFLENAPEGVTIQSSGDTVAIIQVNTYQNYTGTGVVVRVSDGVLDGEISFNVSATIPPIERLELTIMAPSITSRPNFISYWLPYGVVTQCVAASEILGQTQYVARGWAGSGSVPPSGTTDNTGSFVLTNDTLLGWSWGTNYWLNTVASNGTLNLGSGWYPSGSQLNVILSPLKYCAFSRWIGDGAASNSVANPLLFSLTQPARLIGICDALVTGQGTPYWWLADHGWTNNFDSVDAVDFDSDGMKTFEEYVSDTDPTNKNSVLSMTGVYLVDNKVIVGWKGGTLASQILEAKVNLANTGEQWVPIFTNMPPTSTTTNVVDLSSNANSNRFYRIRASR